MTQLLGHPLILPITADISRMQGRAIATLLALSGQKPCEPRSGCDERVDGLEDRRAGQQLRSQQIRTTRRDAKVVTGLGQKIGQFQVEGVTDAGQQLRRGLLLTPFDLGEITEAHPGTARNIAQRASLVLAVRAQPTTQSCPHQRHGSLPFLTRECARPYPLDLRRRADNTGFAQGVTPTEEFDIPAAPDPATTSESRRSAAATAASRISAREPVRSSRRT